MDDQDTMKPAMGRRRARLLSGEAGGEAQRLCRADVEALARDPSAEARAMIAAKFGNQYDQIIDDGQGDLAGAVLKLLLRDVAKEVRQSLSGAIAGSLAVPSQSVLMLANDDIEIARPVLEKSPVLTDEDLLNIVRTNAMQYALAVAGRERLSETLSEALVDTGAQPVVVRLVGNAGAKLSSKTLNRVMEDYRQDGAVQDRLVRRPELPFELVEQIVGVISDRLEWEIVKTGKLETHVAQAIMRSVRERAAITMTAKDHGDRSQLIYLRDRFQADDLGHEELLRLLRDGDIASFEIGMSLHAEFDIHRTRRLLYSKDRRHLAALCIKAGMVTAHYIIVRLAIELAEDSLKPDGNRSQSLNSQALHFQQQQYEKLKLDKAKLHELISV